MYGYFTYSDGTVIHPHEARLLGRFLQTMEDFKSGKAGIDTGKLVNYGISDQPLEELQILLRRIPATCNLADNLFEYLASSKYTFICISVCTEHTYYTYVQLTFNFISIHYWEQSAIYNYRKWMQYFI